MKVYYHAQNIHSRKFSNIHVLLIASINNPQSNIIFKLTAGSDSLGNAINWNEQNTGINTMHHVC